MAPLDYCRGKVLFIFLIFVQHFVIFTVSQDIHRARLDHHRPYNSRQAAIARSYGELGPSQQHHVGLGLRPHTVDIGPTDPQFPIRPDSAIQAGTENPNNVFQNDKDSKQFLETDTYWDSTLDLGIDSAESEANGDSTFIDTTPERDTDHARIGLNSFESSEDVYGDDDVIPDDITRPIYDLTASGNDDTQKEDDYLDLKTSELDAGQDISPAVLRENEGAASNPWHRGVDNNEFANHGQQPPDFLSNVEESRAPGGGQTTYPGLGLLGPDRSGSIDDREFYQSQPLSMPMDSHLDASRFSHPRNTDDGRSSGSHINEAEGTNPLFNGPRQIPFEAARNTNPSYPQPEPTEHQVGYLSRGIEGPEDDYSPDDRNVDALRNFMDIPQDAEALVSMEGPGWTPLDVPIGNQDIPFSTLDDRDTSDSLTNEYKKYFSELDDSIAFEMPELHVNCWLQSMMATTWGFSPSCNEDGTYGPKQCHEKRCWCVNQAGGKVQHGGGKTDHGFYFGLRGLTLYCSEN